MSYPRSVLLLVAFVACVACREAPPATTSATSAAPSGQRWELFDAQGAAQLTIVARGDGGYRLEDPSGKKIGKVSVSTDRVKVKDAAGALRAKVKKKDKGFKLYAPDDRVLLVGKLSGDNGLKLRREDGTEIGRLKGASGQIQGAAVQARPTEAGVDVSSGEQIVGRIRGQIRVEPALLLSLPEMDLYQQAALLTFVQEVW